MKQERDPQTYAIIGAAMDVHRYFGPGFLEGVYQEALAIELADRGVPFDREVGLTVHYKGQPLVCRYRADFICYGEIIVEIKAQDHLSGSEEAQVLNYLKVTGFQRSLLINFGGSSLEYKRLVLSDAHRSEKFLSKSV